MQPDPANYGDGLADLYDQIYPVTPEVGLCADFVQRHTPAGGSVLEFGIGTGRIALALADRGLVVHGVDASSRMLSKLANKVEESAITWELGDFTKIDCGQAFDTVLIALNTLYMVPSQDQQIAVLENARRHLNGAGCVIIDVYDPTHLHSLPQARDTIVQHLDRESILLCDIQIDRVHQIAAIGQTYMRTGEMRKTPEISRYAWPAELDLMARIAGLRRIARTEDWEGRRFQHTSTRHISVYEPTP